MKHARLLLAPALFAATACQPVASVGALGNNEPYFQSAMWYRVADPAGSGKVLTSVELYSFEDACDVFVSLWLDHGIRTVGASPSNASDAADAWTDVLPTAFWQAVLLLEPADEDEDEVAGRLQFTVEDGLPFAGVYGWYAEPDRTYFDASGNADEFRLLWQGTDGVTIGVVREPGSVELNGRFSGTFTRTADNAEGELAAGFTAEWCPGVEEN